MEFIINAIATGKNAITYNADGVNLSDQVEYGGIGAIFKSYEKTIAAYQM